VELFAAGLQMPPHLVFTEILLKYRVRLHQSTPNAIDQLSKYFWVVMSFGGEPSNDGFTKRYELHYQPKKVIVGGFERFQYSVLSIFMLDRVVRWGSLRLSRTSGQPDR
jgi:hypothetical protein